MVVLNTDVLKSSLIHSGVSVADAGAVTYAATLALAHDLLQQGQDVLLDSPCRYEELLECGQQIAREHGVRYAFIELWVRDWTTVLARLDARSPMPSQIASATAPAPGTVWELGTAEETLARWQTQLVRPERDWLRLEAEGAAEENLDAALRYLHPDR